MTDLQSVVSLMDANIELNKVLLRNHSNCCQNIRTTALEWGVSIESSKYAEDILKCDLVVASDVVYYPEGYAPLLNTIISLIVAQSDRNITMILAHRHRHPQDGEFFESLHAQSLLNVTIIPWKSDLGFISGGSLSDVKLLKIMRKDKS
jgi:predicted nicotinamide N-methyase